MILKCIVVDEKGVVGPSIPVVHGETKTLNVFWYNANGSPYVAPSISAIVVKILAQLNMIHICRPYLKINKLIILPLIPLLMDY